MLKKHSHTIAIICGGLNMLPWVIFGIYTLCFPESAVPYDTFEAVTFACIFSFSLAGLSGSLFLSKKPMLGITLMLISGMLSFAAGNLNWWAGIPPILLTAAGILAYISVKASPGKPPQSEDPYRAVKAEKRRHFVKSLSRAFGVAGSLPALLLLLYFIIKYLITLSYPGFSAEQEDCTYGYLVENIIAVLLLVSALTCSLFVFKKPLLVGLLMIISGTFALCFIVSTCLLPYELFWLAMIPAAFLIAAGALALAGYNNTPVSLPQNECREPAGQ